MRKAVKNIVVDALLLILLGLILLIKPGQALETLFRVLGVGVLLMGAVKIAVYFGTKEEADRSLVALIAGIVEVIVGLLLLIKPVLFISLWYIAVALIITCGAVIGLIRGIRQLQARFPGAPITVVLAALTLILAVIVLLNPAAFAAFHTQLTGISMIVEGITLLFASIWRAN